MFRILWTQIEMDEWSKVRQITIVCMFAYTYYEYCTVVNGKI